MRINESTVRSAVRGFQCNECRNVYIAGVRMQLVHMGGACVLASHRGVDAWGADAFDAARNMLELSFGLRVVRDQVAATIEAEIDPF